MTHSEGLKTLKDSRPGDRCLLCGSNPEVIGVFVPENPEIYGGIKGKTRLIRYCLCARCHSKQGAAEIVEKVIYSELGKMEIVPCQA